MPLTEAVNQKAYDAHKAREKGCIQWLKTMTRPVRKTVLCAAMAGLGSGLGFIAQAALMATVVHALIIERQTASDLLKPVLALLLVFGVRSVCAYAQQIFGFQAGARIKHEVRLMLSEKLAKLGPAYLKQRQSGELAAVSLEQVEALENYFARYLPQQMLVAVLPLTMIAVVMPVNWVVGLIFLITGPLVPVFMALVGMGAASANRSQFLALARMGGYFLDRLQGLSTLKLFGQVDHELLNIEKTADDFRNKTLAVLRIAFLSSAVLEFFSAVAVGLVAVYVGLGLLRLVHFGPADTITLQEALFVLLLAPEFFLPLRQLAIHYHDRAAAIGAAEQILTVLEQDDGGFGAMVFDAKASSDFMIEYRGVTKTYERRKVLSDINLQIRTGEKVALVGESGAGKTTLLNLLLGFETVSQGRIYLAGRSVSRELAARHCAWVGQQAYIFAGSIRDNIALAVPDASEQAVCQAAKAAGVDMFSERLPDGIDTRIGERGYGLSGGQVQRIALARAFLKPAQVVLLDEPTANLDADNKRRLLDTIDALFQHRTVVIASHDQEAIERMGRRIDLVHGRVQA